MEASTRKHLFYAWICWFVSCMLYFIQYGLLILPAAITKELEQTYSISSGGVGVFSSVFLLPYVILQIPAGVIVDRFNVRLVLIISGFLLAIGCFILAGTDSFSAGIFARLIMGLGGSITFVATLYLGRIWFPEKLFPFIVVLTGLTTGLSIIVFDYFFSVMKQSQTWQYIVVEVGIFTLIWTLLIFFIVRDIEKPRLERYAEIKNDILSVLKTKQIWLLGLYIGLGYSHFMILASVWDISLLQYHYHVSITEAVYINSFAIIGFMCGCVLVGTLRRYISALKITISFMFIEVILLSVAISGIGDIWASLTMLFISGVLTAGTMLAFDLVREIMPSNFYGCASGFLNMFFGGFGLLLLPLMGWMLEITNQDYFISSLPVFVASVLALILIIWFAVDLRKQSK